MKNWIKYGRVNFGGIKLVFRYNLSKFIIVYVIGFKIVFWFEILKMFIKLEKNLLVGIV